MTTASQMETTDALRERVAEEIRALMARRRVTQMQLAAAMGVSQTYVSSRLNGRVAFDLDDLERIAAFFSVPVVTLITGQIPPKGDGSGRATYAFLRRRHVSKEDLGGPFRLPLEAPVLRSVA